MKPLQPPRFAVVGLGFGDEGKGATVDFLVRQCVVWAEERVGGPEEWLPPLVVRYNGGPQAAHRVVTPDRKVHIFSQLGSGSFLPGTLTWLSHFMAVDLLTLEREAQVFARAVGLPTVDDGAPEVLSRVWIDANCVLVTPWHKALNRLQELLRPQRHGSCGMGVGQALLDAEDPAQPVLRARDVLNPQTLMTRLLVIQAEKAAAARQLLEQLPPEALTPELQASLEPQLTMLNNILVVRQVSEAFRDIVSHSGLHLAESEALLELMGRRPVVFEGAQGVLLDRNFGFFPHVTPSHTTLRNVLALLPEDEHATLIKVGVLRTYLTRHGRGPFPSENPKFTEVMLDMANRNDPWQETFRVGWLDLILLRYGMAVVGPLDFLALNCMDRLGEGLPELVDRWNSPEYGVIEGLEPLPLTASLDERLALTRRVQSSRWVTRLGFGHDIVFDESRLPPSHFAQHMPASRLQHAPDFEEHCVKFLSLLAHELGMPVAVIGWGEQADARGWYQS